MSKFILVLSVLLSLAFVNCSQEGIVIIPCSLYDDWENFDIECPEHLLDEPVCAFKDNEIVTLADACQACRDQNVYGYAQGVCTNEQKEQFTNQEIGKCDPHNRPEVCTEEFQPGFCGNLIEPPQDASSYKQYGTLCQVCQDTNVDFYAKGNCKTYENGLFSYSNRLNFIIGGLLISLSILM